MGQGHQGLTDCMCSTIGIVNIKQKSEPIGLFLHSDVIIFENEVTTQAASFAHGNHNHPRISASLRQPLY
jgi:hypothetical protein